MDVTFDTNAWTKIIRLNDNSKKEYLKINQALKNGIIKGFICETVVTLEAIPKDKRLDYFANRRTNIRFEESISKNGTISGVAIIGDDYSIHPGITKTLEQLIEELRALGILMLNVSRVGTCRPTQLENDELFKPFDCKRDIWEYLEGFSNISNEIENRNVGMAIIKNIAKQVAGKAFETKPWFEHLNLVKDKKIQKDVAEAIAEWADGDSIAVHINNGHDYFCTEDFGKKAKISILNAENRSWLEQKYGVKFTTLRELAEII